MILPVYFVLLFQGLQDEVQSLQPQLDYLQDFVDSLITDADTSVDTRPILASRDDLVGRHEVLERELEDLVVEMENASQSVAEWQDGVRQAAGEITDLDDQLDHQSPPARDTNTVQDQLENLQVGHSDGTGNTVQCQLETLRYGIMMERKILYRTT